jgi:hypothetical protein
MSGRTTLFERIKQIAVDEPLKLVIGGLVGSIGSMTYVAHIGGFLSNTVVIWLLFICNVMLMLIMVWTNWGRIKQLWRRPRVEFLLPGEWGKGFQFRNDLGNEQGGEQYAEELALEVVARDKMQDCRLEVAVYRIDGHREKVVAQITGEKFSGIVPKGTRERIVLMLRHFLLVPAYYSDTPNSARLSKNIRIERNVVFFPDNAESAPIGQLDEQYRFKIALLHDDGPDEAILTIWLHTDPGRPFSQITKQENVQFAKPASHLAASAFYIA